MNTFSKALIAATITLGAVSAQAAQGEQYQFNDGPSVTITASNPNIIVKSDERGQYDVPVASTVTRATVKAMVNDKGGLLSIPRA
jgi:hypothetical protein